MTKAHETPAPGAQVITAAELAEGWAKVDAGTHKWQTRCGLDGQGWITVEAGPNAESITMFWRLYGIPKRVVDLSVLVDSGIDCEFPPLGYPDSWYLRGALANIDDGLYQSALDGSICTRCRPRHNHWMAWIPHDHSECPVPKGFKGDVMVRNGDVMTREGEDLASWLLWNKQHNMEKEIIAYRITGLADGWCYPWEVES